MKEWIKRLPIIFGCWSLYFSAVGLITAKMWDYYGYGMWKNRDAEKSILYVILSGSIQWYLKPSTLLFTILISLIISISSVVIIILKASGRDINISYSILAVWLILNFVNIPLWLWLLGIQ